MVNPVGGSLPPFDPTSTLFAQVKEMIEALSSQLKTVIADPSVADEHSFLQQVANTINKSEPLAEMSRTMQRNKSKDTSENFHHLLMQPLGLFSGENPITLLSASHHYDGKNPSHSDLNKVMRTFASHPEMAQALINELDLISKDL